MVPHPVDANGLDLSVARERFGKDDVFYIMPEHHFPQCVTLSDARRAAIESLALEAGVLVIEDDYDSEYYYDRRPKPALKAGPAASSIIYLGTFSKTLFNNLRLGYLVAESSLVREMATLHWSLSRGTSGILQRWVAELVADGALDRHVRRMRTVYRRKRDRIAEVLRRDFPEWQFELPKGGLQFYLDLGSSDRAAAVIELCRSKRLRVALPSNYVPPDEAPQRFLVLGFGSVPLAQIEGALAELRHVLAAVKRE
jgi:GntR family transcriptional regulator/MocR family aminotransferase